MQKKLKRVHVTFTLPKKMKAELDQMAIRTKRFRGVCIEIALEKFFYNLELKP